MQRVRQLLKEKACITIIILSYSKRYCVILMLPPHSYSNHRIFQSQVLRTSPSESPVNHRKRIAAAWTINPSSLHRRVWPLPLLLLLINRTRAQHAPLPRNDNHYTEHNCSCDIGRTKLFVPVISPIVRLVMSGWYTRRAAFCVTGLRCSHFGFVTVECKNPACAKAVQLILGYGAEMRHFDNYSCDDPMPRQYTATNKQILISKLIVSLVTLPCVDAVTLRLVLQYLVTGRVVWYGCFVH